LGKTEYEKDATSEDSIREWHELNFNGNRLTQTVQAAVRSADPLIAGIRSIKAHRKDSIIPAIMAIMTFMVHLRQYIIHHRLSRDW